MPRSRTLRLAAPLLLLLAGCRSSAPHGPVEFWAMGTEGERVQQLLPEFTRRTGIEVQVQQIPWSAAHEKLLTAFVAGTLPDVLQLGNTWIPEMVAVGALAAVDGPLQAAGGGADFFPGVLDTNVIDGATYGVPWYVDTRVLFYRRDLLAEAGVAAAPTTWAGWLDAMERLRRRGGGKRFAVFLPLNEWQVPVLFGLQAGAGLLRDGDRRGDFRSPAFRRGFAFFVDLFRRGLAPFSGEAQIANVYQDFADGFFSFYISGPWNLGEFRRRLPPALADAWATAPLPGLDEGHPGVSLAGGASLALARGGRRPAQAWKLVEFLTDAERQRDFYRLTGDLPSRRSAWDDPVLRDDERAAAFRAQLQNVRSTPKVPEWERVAQLVTRYAEAAVRGEMTQDAALQALDAETDAVLEKRRWMLDRAGARPGGGHS